ncbi:hypothetical protein SAMN02910292_02565 [Lachnospiraceae bacterium XBB2008]|nr:hypothetical protein SAMN02910292_02565 [Lachnospiraceae bacterium XBB2008]
MKHDYTDDDWYKDEDDDQIWWLDNGRYCKGEHVFSFDKKKQYNLFADYPYNMTPEEVVIFDRENPFWAYFFRDRKGADSGYRQTNIGFNQGRG